MWLLFEMAVILRFWWFKNIEKNLTCVHARVIPVLVVGPLAATSVRGAGARGAARSQAGLLCGRAAVAAGRSPLAVRRPFLTSKQAAAKKSSACGGHCHGAHLVVRAGTAEKVSYGCTKYELRGVSLLDTRVPSSARERSITGSSACRSFACVHVRLAVHRGVVVLQSCPVVPVPLLWMAAVPHLAAVHAALTDFCLQGPVPKIFGACGGHRARSLALQNTGQIQARPGQRSVR